MARHFTHSIQINRFIILLFPLFFAACSPDTSRLPDDPDNEPIVQPETDREGSEDLPSKGEDLLPPEGSSPISVGEKEQILSKYDYVDPTHIVPTKALEQALLYYDLNKANLKNTKVF